MSDSSPSILNVDHGTLYGTFLNLRNSNSGESSYMLLIRSFVVVSSGVSEADARVSPRLVDYLVQYIIYIYTPFFKDVLVHPEITVRHMLRLSWQ